MFPGQYLRQVNRDERKVLMLLENKNAIVYGAGGAIGGAVARAFARDGARVSWPAAPRA
jgi:FlaA1/EpsC-like NDP-sugar epimerase